MSHRFQDVIAYRVKCADCPCIMEGETRSRAPMRCAVCAKARKRVLAKDHVRRVKQANDEAREKAGRKQPKKKWSYVHAQQAWSGDWDSYK